MDSISLEEQWVVFRKGEVQGHTHHHIAVVLQLTEGHDDDGCE